MLSCVYSDDERRLPFVMNVRLQMGNTRIISERCVRIISRHAREYRDKRERKMLGLVDLDRERKRSEWEALSMKFLWAPRWISSSCLVSAQIENTLLSSANATPLRQQCIRVDKSLIQPCKKMDETNKFKRNLSCKSIFIFLKSKLYYSRLKRFFALYILLSILLSAGFKCP